LPAGHTMFNLAMISMWLGHNELVPYHWLFPWLLPRKAAAI